MLIKYKDVCFGRLLNNCGQQLKRENIISDTGVLLCGFGFRGSIVSQDEKSSCKLYMYIYTRITYITDSLF